jgi:hypothetical protein
MSRRFAEAEIAEVWERRGAGGWGIACCLAGGSGSRGRELDDGQLASRGCCYLVHLWGLIGDLDPRRVTRLPSRPQSGGRVPDNLVPKASGSSLSGEGSCNRCR